MCDTHLVPDVDETRAAFTPFSCGECGEQIACGQPYRHIEGVLDDGKPGRFLYRAHDDCYQLTVYDYDDNDGCFMYGNIEEIRQ